MRLLLDEHLDPNLAVQLRARGHDAVAVAAEPALRGLSDVQLLDLATARVQVIATYNARHGRCSPRSTSTHPRRSSPVVPSG